MSRISPVASLVVSISKDLTEKGYHSGKIAKKIAQELEGSGGGKPEFAQGGGKKADNLKNIFENIENFLN